MQSPLNYASGNTQGQLVAFGYTGSQLTSMAWGYGSADQVAATFGYSGTQLVTVTAGIQGSNLGHAWLLRYDGQGRLSYVVSPVSGTVGQTGYTPNYTTLFLYNPGQTVLVQGYTQPGQQATVYTLDAQGEAITVSDSLGDASSASYDADHDVLTSTDQDHNTTTNYYQYVGPAGSTGLITETDRPSISPDFPGNALAPITTTYKYDPSFNLIETDTSNDSVTGYTYDSHHGQLSKVELVSIGRSCPPSAPKQAAATPNTTCTLQYNWRGQLTSYDPYGERVSSTNGNGVAVPTTVAASPPPPPTPGACPGAQCATTYTHSYTYTTQGDLSKESTPPIATTLNGVTTTGPATTSYGYDADGNQISQTSANGHTTTYGYDHLGRQTQVNDPAVQLYTGQTITPTETTSYDGDGNVIQQIDGAGDVTADSYDPLGRLVAETDPVSGTTLYTYNATEKTSERDPQGNVTSDQYDAAGRLIRESDPAGSVTQYQYDPAGNTTAINIGDGQTPSTTETRQYDALDELVTDTVTGPGPNAPTLQTIRGYDQGGNVVQVQQPNGDVVLNSYDQADELTSASELTGPGGSVVAQEFDSYDNAGNVLSSQDFNGDGRQDTYDGDNRATQSVDTNTAGTTHLTTTRSFDPDGNTLTRTVQTASPGVLQTHTYTATYNADDWLTASGDDGQATQYTYDAAGQQHSETLLGGATPLTSVLDAQGRATTIGENLGGTGPYSSTFGYNLDDAPLTVTLHSDTPSTQAQETFQYDLNSRLTTVTAVGPTGVITPLNSAYDYAYSPGGWTSALTWTVSGAVTATQLGDDAASRLTSWTGQPNGPESWGYDPNGNMITNTEFISDAIRTTVFTYTASQPNQVVQQHTDGLGVEYFGYDQNGATTSITSTDPAYYPNGQVDPYHVNIGVQYDGQGRPITLTTLEGGVPITVALGYDAQGQRSRYTVTMSGTTTLDERMQYRSDALGQMSATTATLNSQGQITSSGAYTDTYLYDQSSQPLELIRQPQGGPTARYWYVLDGRANVVALIDSSGNTVDQYAYDPWGEGLPQGSSESVPQPFRYGGYWWDKELGWYWVGVRFYDPEGRWLQPDPSEADGVRTYVYADDDPLDESDPSGMVSGGACLVGSVCYKKAQSQGPDPLDRLIRGIASGVYQFAIGGDIDTLHSRAQPWQKALALADIVLTVVPAEKIVKGGVAAIRLAKAAADAVHARVDADIVEHAAEDLEQGRSWLQGVGCATCFVAGTLTVTAHDKSHGQRH